MKFETQLPLRGDFIFKLFDASIVKEYSDIGKGGLLEVHKYHNLVVNTAKNQYAQLIGDLDGTFADSNTGAINYLAVGTGLSSPAVTDTMLQTEIARAAPDAPTPTVVDNVVTIDFFFAAPDAIGNLKEVGAFIDGTAVADTGVLFDRAEIDIDKTPLTSLLIQLVVTVV